MDKNRVTYISKKEGQGKFRIFKALEVDKNGFIKTFKDKDSGQFFLKGAATNAVPDKEDEHPSVAFIEKNKSDVVGLNVFLDHDHKVVDTVGYISESGGNEGEMILTTALENPEKNLKVKMVLEKIEHGTKIAYSIGGKVTKASEYYNKDLGRKIVEFDEGFITEITLTPYPAAYDTDVSQIQKSLMKTLETMEKVEPEDDSVFWEDYEKAENKYKNLSDSQPSVEDLKKTAPHSNCCFVQVGDQTADDLNWDNLYRWTTTGTGDEEYHYKGLDSSWYFVNQPENNAPKEAIEVLQKVRKELGLDSKTLYFLDFEKVVSSSLSEMLDDKVTSDRLRNIVNVFSDVSWSILYDTDKDIEEKFKEISQYAKELVDLLSVEFKEINEKTLSKIVALSLTMDEVLAMKKTEKIEKTTVDEVEEVLDDATKEKLASVVKDIITKALDSGDKKEEKKVEKKVDEAEEKKIDSKDEEIAPVINKVMQEFIVKTIKELASQSDEADVNEDLEKDKKLAKTVSDEDKGVNISDDAIALALVKFFDDNPDIKLTGVKKSFMKTLERDQGVNIEEIINDEEKFDALDDDVKKTLVAKCFSGMIGQKS